MYISRKDALAVFGDVHPMDYNTNAYIEKIKAIPAADVAERKHGKWIDSFADDGFVNRNCSLCGQFVSIYNNYNFCPNCGADMRGDDDV